MWRELQLRTQKGWKQGKLSVNPKIQAVMERPTKKETVQEFRKRLNLLDDKSWADWLHNDLITLVQQDNFLANVTDPSWKDVAVIYDTYLKGLERKAADVVKQTPTASDVSSNKPETTVNPSKSESGINVTSNQPASTLANTEKKGETNVTVPPQVVADVLKPAVEAIPTTVTSNSADVAANKPIELPASNLTNPAETKSK